MKKILCQVRVIFRTDAAFVVQDDGQVFVGRLGDMHTESNEGLQAYCFRVDSAARPDLIEGYLEFVHAGLEDVSALFEMVDDERGELWLRPGSELRVVTAPQVVDRKP